MGAGVQTTAMLIKYTERYKNGWLMFADTGDEKPETYWYLDKYIKPYCKENGLRFETLHNSYGMSLMEYSNSRKTLPQRHRRWCTGDFKIKPINRFLRSKGATKRNPYYTDIGFSIDEAHRVNTYIGDVQYIRKGYPLLDDKVSRSDCYDIIRDHGWPVPTKSGCDFCMFASEKQFAELAISRPERFEEIIAMEKNEKFYPRFPLLGKHRHTMEQVKELATMGTFDDVADEEMLCESGHCFR